MEIINKWEMTTSSQAIQIKCSWYIPLQLLEILLYKQLDSTAEVGDKRVREACFDCSNSISKQHLLHFNT